MNKKILSIFALIMAISILGVSCAKDNNTTNPTTGGSTAPITLDQAKKIVEAIGTLTESTSSTSFDFSTAKVAASGADYTVTVSSADATKTVKYQAFLTAIKGKKSAMDGAENNLITVDDAKITLDMTDGGKTATATIPYALKSDSKKTGKFVITFTLTAGDSSFAYDEITKANVQAALQGMGSSGSVTVGGNPAGKVTFAGKTLDADGAITVVAQPTSGTAGVQAAEVVTAVEGALKAISGLTGVTANTITVDGTGLTAGKNTGKIVAKLTPDAGYKFKTGGSDFTASSGPVGADGVLTITITVNSKQQDGSTDANFQ